ncbi:MAG TPA: ATP-dependent DNA helicase [Candidatus Cybelea sp.]|nr:ATP-dependent DNA helicase [Candidatus Cybelea sp.]
MPDAPVLAVGAREAVWLSADGEIETLTLNDAAARAADTAPMVIHAPEAAAKLRRERFRALDLLELFAFVRPAHFVLPTANGLAVALGVPRPRDHAAEAMMVRGAAETLLAELASFEPAAALVAARIASTMAKGGWRWAPSVLAALGEPAPGLGPFGGLDAWNRLAEWSEHAPEPPPGDLAVSPEDARKRLKSLVGEHAEARPQQSDYAAAAAAAFAPRDLAGTPNLVLAEAGTGVGKTLGYVAPASLWAERNHGPVWIATFTRNLQRQIDQELDRLYPDPAVKAMKAVIRKGRENYLCLLNLEEAAQGGAMRPDDAVALGLMARWAEATRDGDMMGGDFPAWLVGLLGARLTLQLADRRGECIHSACPYYRKCYIERAIRKSRRADIVIANHALVMIQAAHAGDARELPTRYVFDEGHHLFDAADGAFSAHLSGSEGSELRRWIRGAEGGRRSRARGLERRIGDLLSEREEAVAAMKACVEAAGVLASDGWLARVAEGAPRGPSEVFLAHVRQQVYARSKGEDGPYSLEATTDQPVPGLIDAARALSGALARLGMPMQSVARILRTIMDDEASDLDTSTRIRFEAAIRSMERRQRIVTAWKSMLDGLGVETPEQFVDWFSVDRIAGRETDVGLHRHWIDPTQPFAATVLVPAHGALITSATLRDRTLDTDDAALWQTAEIRTGAAHLPLPAVRASLPSPFDYAARTRILVVNDVRRDQPAQVAAAYRELFLASGGGALGLFTAITRLRAVHARIAGALEDAGLQLYAQHVDAIDTPTLIDIFRAETDACLLGTDAVRDGVDVPGRSLRLIVFDRVPWARPDILHRARRNAFGGQAYDDMIARLRLKQAYGRLLRRAEDIGVFVMLDAALPSRLLSAFPQDVAVQRIGLAEAIRITGEFLRPSAA